MIETTLQDITLDQLIEIILCNNKILCTDSSYTGTEVQLLKDIQGQIEQQEFSDITKDITDYGDICRDEGIHMGLKLGMKIMKEINKL